MGEVVKKIKIAINGGIGFGAKLNAKQLFYDLKIYERRRET